MHARLHLGGTGITYTNVPPKLAPALQPAFSFSGPVGGPLSAGMAAREGDRDTLPEHGPATARGLRNAEILTLDRGHFSPVEATVALAPAVETFLRR
jgi:hypothetical protein